MVPVPVSALRDVVVLPPGQRAIATFPRRGVHVRRPVPPRASSIRIGGDIDVAFDIRVSDLAGMPREEITADFHCVAGWSCRDLRWDGVRFATFYDAVIAPRVPAGVQVNHVLFRGGDGYEAALLLEDACVDNVLLADQLDGAPLTGAHGAPVRLVSPSQYGHKSVKHLNAIEVHAHEPRERDARLLFARLGRPPRHDIAVGE
jgi:DMSO/TMAO reductase YedYZ molybdopterin-dependent catalytic subunit